jgi:large subunit ribosomal protein L22e
MMAVKADRNADVGVLIRTNKDSFSFIMPGKVVKKQAKNLKFSIECSAPAQHNIFVPEDLEKFLHDRIKVNGKAGQLGETVKVNREKTKITVEAKAPFSKRYLKYLVKKFLKKQQLRDWLKVVANNKTSYEIRFFNIDDIEAAEEN